MKKIKSIRPVDLRGILKYVPQFRNHIFVIALDGSIVSDDNFINVVTDIAVLRSLNIKVILVHGIGHQIRELSILRKTEITDAYGIGPTDEKTLQLAKEASAMTSHLILEALTQADLKCGLTNAIRASELGIIKGIDQGYTAKIDKIEVKLIESLLEKEIVPIINPIVFDRSGNSLRVNSDHLAAELSIQLKASKLIYLSPYPGLTVKGETMRNIPIEQLERIIAPKKPKIEERLISKAQHSINALRNGPPRAHILDGRLFGCLLTEVFDKVGLGTMIHANEYQKFRSAKKKDAQAIYNITRHNVRKEALTITHTRQSIEKNIKNFIVYEIDDSIIACSCLQPYPKTTVVELSCLNVQSFYENKGVGKKMVEFACIKAKKRGAKRIIALSTQAYNFFTKVCDFKEGSVRSLPAARLKDYKNSKRNSRILVKTL